MATLTTSLLSSAGFALGCVGIHLMKRHAEALGGMLSVVAAVLMLMLIVVTGLEVAAETGQTASEPVDFVNALIGLS